MSASLAELFQRVVEADRAVARAVADRALAYAAVEAAAVESAIASAGDDGDEIAASVRSAHAELALRLGLTSRSVATRAGAAAALVERPAVLRALQQGEITETHAKALVAASDHVDAALAAEVTDAVLAAEAHRDRRREARRTPGQLGTAVRLELARRDAGDRRQRAAADRDVRLRPLPDGMAQLTAVLPAADAVAVVGALRTLAAPGGSGDRRSLGQRMADALVGVFTRGSSGFRAQVQVLVPVASLAGASTEPGLLVGYGPLDAAACRALAAAGELRRVLVDGSGRVVGVDDRAHRPARVGAGRAPSRSSRAGGARVGRSPSELADALRQLLRGEGHGYRPPRRLRRLVETRDLTCRFPGCSCPASAADLDHVVPWPRGRTQSSNLVALCATHHRLKHSRGWRLALEPGGDVTWTTPTGLRVTSPAPSHAVPPVRADEVRAVSDPRLPAGSAGEHDADRFHCSAYDDAELDAVLRALAATSTRLDEEPPFAPTEAAVATAQRRLAEAAAWEAELAGDAMDDATDVDALLAAVADRPRRLATDADAWPDAEPECTDWDVLAETNPMLALRMAVEESRREAILATA